MNYRERIPHPPGTFDRDEVFYCDNNCGTYVAREGQWCHACILENDTACGDIDNDDFREAEKTLPDLAAELRNDAFNLREAIKEDKAYQKKCKDHFDEVSRRNRERNSNAA